MSNIEIKEVVSRRDMSKFIKFADDLYKGNDCYVPQMHGDLRDMFSPKKNPSYEYCESLLILAYKDGKIAGRMAAIINYPYNEKENKKYLRFTHFDVIDDVEVSEAMFEYIGDWGKDKGMDTFNGPLGFTDLDRQDMLIEGFDKIGMFITNYNYPYYVKHMEQLGFKKDVDHVEYLVKVPEKVDPRVERVKDAVLKKFGLKLLKFTNVKDLKKYIYKAFDVYNKEFFKLHGTVMISDAQVELVIKQNISLIDLKYVPIIVDKDDEVVGFAVLAPSLARAAQKAKGKMLPFGWYHMLHALKHKDTLDMYLVAIKEEYQGLGLNALLLHDVTKCAIEDGVKYAETGPELENNYKVRSQWDNYDAEIIRKRRCYIREI